jgi:hypothetical protein
MEIFDVIDAEKLHGSASVGKQQVGRSLDTRFAARHEPVQVGASGQAGSSAMGDGSDDVRTRHDAAVDVDLGPVADCGRNAGQLL